MLPVDPLKNIQDAWLLMLLRFRAWYLPETSQTKEWKFRPVAEAIRSCRSTLMDDAEGMLVAYRKNPNNGDMVGPSAAMPVMLTATAVVDMPPDASQLLGTPYLVDAAYGDKSVRVRVVPTAVRAQMAFFSTNPHDARSLAGQFCTYLADDWTRKVNVEFAIGNGYHDKFKFIVFDNNVMPAAIPSEALNLTIFTVDVTLVGYVPQVLGLELDGENSVHMPYNPDGSENNSFDPVTGVPTQPLVPPNGEVVIQADQFDEQHTRILADRDTGSITVQKIRD